MTSYEAVSADPVGSASSVRAWAQAHQALLLHLDADALDFARFPLAEHTRRNVGLSFDALMSSLQELLRIPGVVGLTITEVNPDHGLEDGSTLRQFATGLAEAMAGTYRG
jgi:arginase family enzyme